MEPTPRAASSSSFERTRSSGSCKKQSRVASSRVIGRQMNSSAKRKQSFPLSDRLTRHPQHQICKCRFHSLKLSSTRRHCHHSPGDIQNPKRLYLMARPQPGAQPRLLRSLDSRAIRPPVSRLALRWAPTVRFMLLLLGVPK